MYLVVFLKSMGLSQFPTKAVRVNSKNEISDVLMSGFHNGRKINYDDYRVFSWNGSHTLPVDNYGMNEANYK